jgi:hypothetical protein
VEGVFKDIPKIIGEYTPNLIGALSILILGWLVALIISFVTRALLKRTTLDNRLTQWLIGDKGKPVESEKWISKGLFYIIMLFVLIAFFQSLGLTMVTDPLNKLLSRVFEFIPRIIGAGLLLLIAWVVASVLRILISKGLGATRIDERLSSQVQIKEKERLPITESLANAVYWLVFLLFLPAILSALALEGLLTPVQDMINSILTVLPNIFAAGVILLIGWFTARIIRGIATNLLSAVGVDRLGEKVGLTKIMAHQRLSGILGMLLYILILIPIAIAALDVLKIESISAPARNMLQTVLNAIPSIFGAALLFVIAYIVGRVVREFITNLLADLGFNAILLKLGVGKEIPEGKKSPSEIVGYLVFVAIMLFAAIEAAQLLQFTAITDLILRFITFAGQIVMGLIIFGIGLYIARTLAIFIEGTGTQQGRTIALVAKVAIIILASAMALRQMGLANEIVTLAFGMLLGAIAVAIALAVGIGSKDIAAREIEKLLSKIKNKEES